MMNGNMPMSKKTHVHVWKTNTAAYANGRLRRQSNSGTMLRS